MNEDILDELDSIKVESIGMSDFDHDDLCLKDRQFIVLLTKHYDHLAKRLRLLSIKNR